MVGTHGGIVMVESPCGALAEISRNGTFFPTEARGANGQRSLATRCVSPIPIHSIKPDTIRSRSPYQSNYQYTWVY